MSRDADLIEEYKKIFQQTINTPNLSDVEGVWHIYEKKGRSSFITKEAGEWGSGIPSPVWFRQNGWTVTPVIVHKIVANR